MYKYEISKYNPKFRDSERRYLKDDWTAVSDIGKTFGTKTLTMEDYKHVEDRYVKSIYTIMEFAQIPFMSVRNAVKSFPFERFQELTRGYRKLYTDTILQIYASVTTLTKIDKAQVGDLVRLLLREDIGAELFFGNKLKVFVGYDFLMGVQSVVSLDAVVPKIESLGLFVEEF